VHIEFMPRIADLGGIIIRMYGDDHNPPHVHVEYDHQHSLVRISPAEKMEGPLRGRELARVLAWVRENEAMLLNKWASLND
jgi:hypothetical protein